MSPKDSGSQTWGYDYLLLTYYTVLGGLWASAWCGRAGPSSRTFLYYVCLYGLFLFSAYRFYVGCDWIGYFINFHTLEPFTFDLMTKDIAHWALIEFVHYLELPYTYLNVFTSCIFFYGVHRLAKRQPDRLAFLVLTFPILIINMPMSAIKQGAAIGFLCLAFVAFLDRRMIFYVMWILAGSLFHSSILAFLLLAPFVRGTFNRRNLLIGLALALPGAYGLSQTESAQVAEVRYVTGGGDAAGAVFRLGILLLSGLFFLFSVAPKWRVQFPDDYKLVLIGAWMMTGFFSLYFVSSVIGDRFGYYLIPLQAMIFARLPYLNMGRSTQFIAVLPYMLLTLVFLVWTQKSRHFNDCYIPYSFSFG